MTLENLLKIGQLKAEPAAPADIHKLFAAVARNIADAEKVGLSAETRFDCAYKAIMQCAMIALRANGYRTATHLPGHHQTAIQSLVHSIGLERQRIIVLDALRKKRNLNDYTGDPIEEAAASQCLKEAKAVYAEVSEWVKMHRPELAAKGTR